MNRLALVVPLALAGCAPKHVYPDGRGIEGQLEREIIALRESVSKLEDEAATCTTGGRADPLYTELVQVLSGTDAQIEQKGIVTVITFPDAHLFGADAESIRAEARMTLDMVATALNGRPDYTIVVEGHTADVAPTPALAKKYPDLWTLSYARAQAVMKVLVKDFHVAPERFTLSARGPTAPLASNDTAAEQARNRRTCIYVYPPGAR